MTDTQPTLVTRYNMAECIGVASSSGKSILVYFDRDKSGTVDPSEFANIGPIDAPVQFKDRTARWDDGKFVPLTDAPAGGVDREGVWGAASVLDARATALHLAADSISDCAHKLRALAGDGE